MKIVVIDSVGFNAGDAGIPAQFSRPTIEWLGARGHEITIMDGFDAEVCAKADAVWTEWCNEDAFNAAGSGVCRRLVIRVRGYELWSGRSLPLDSLAWKNVSALIYESKYLHDTAAPRGFPVRQAVIPGGFDPGRFAFKPSACKEGVVAMIGRADGIKGYDLALEWMHRRPDLELCLSLSGGDPRVILSLRQMAPSNVHIETGRVDTPAWLRKVGARYLLSASVFESLGYTIVEAMAMGIRPLVRDRPGVSMWPFPTWRTLGDLDALLQTAPSPSLEACARFAIENFDVHHVAPKFEALLLDSPALPVRASVTASVAEVDAYSTHAPFLAWAVANSTGRILELGAGAYSTPLIHALAPGREVLSLESDSAYVKLLSRLATSEHRIEQVSHWDLPLLDEEWGLAFIDNVAEARAPCLKRLKDRARIIVIHDTNKAEWYKVDTLIPQFKYVVRCDWFSQETTVVSMTDPLGGLRDLLGRRG